MADMSKILRKLQDGLTVADFGPWIVDRDSITWDK